MRTLLLTVLLSSLLAGCGGRSVIDRAVESAPQCELLSADVSPPESITVGMLEDVLPAYAPWGRNATERLLFHHLYETLFTVSCDNQVLPALASHWHSERGGRRWVFELRPNAEFWDGSKATAERVVENWQDPITTHAAIDSAVADGPRRVVVYLSEPSKLEPRVLSSPAFSITRYTPESYWPMGTGPYRLARNSSWVVAAEPMRSRRPLIEFRRISLRASRELLEDGVDVLVTSHPEIIEYARGRPQLTTVPLPYARTYVLLSISRSEALRLGHPVADVPDDFGARMAKDAVRTDARACEGSLWWEDPCDHLRGPATKPRGSTDLSGMRRVVYESDDMTARDIAERIIALGVTDALSSADAAAITAAVPGLDNDRGTLVAQGLAPGAFASSLKSGDDFCYVVAVPHRPADVCYETGQLFERAPWLRESGAPLQDILVPLVDARDHVIARRDRFGVVTDWYANVLIVNTR